MPSPPFTDPWLPAPDPDTGFVAAVRPAIAVSVWRVIGSPGSYTYTELPNVVCMAIEEHEGPAPSAAQFRYRFAGDDPAGPQSIEQALSTVFSGAHVVVEGDRLAVWAVQPNVDGTGQYIFDGYALTWHLALSDDTETCVIGAVGVAKVCWDAPCGGAVIRDSQDPETVSDVPTGRVAQFNPRGLPNASPYTADSGTSPYSYPVFLDPGVTGTDTSSREYPRAWELSMAAAYLIFRNNTGLLIGNPERSFLETLLVARIPGDSGYDPNDSSTYTTVPIQVPDTPVTGRNWPNVLHELIRDSGFGMGFTLSTDPDTEEPVMKLGLWLKQARAAKPVLLPARGSSFDPQWCNVGSAAMSRDLAPVVNRWRVRGALDRYEVSFVLAPGFPSQASDWTTDANKLLWDSADPAFTTTAAYNAYRLFVLDEAGQSHYVNTSTTKVTGVPTSLDGVFGAPVEDVPQYVVRRRPPVGRLFAVDSQGKPLPYRVAISTDYAGPSPGVWDGTGHWHEDVKGCDLLKDQIGVRIGIKNPNSWNVGASEDATAPFGSGIVQAVQCLATPAASTPAFFLRLTCVIEADQGLVAEAGSSGASPISRAIWREVDARDRYAYQTIHYPSEFNPAGGALTEDTVHRDDTVAAKAEAVALRTASEAGVFEGHVTIPRFTTYYQIGDRISSIQGRDLGLRTDNGGSGWAPVYPVVVSRRWDLDGRQTTTLTLSDSGLNRRRYAVTQPKPHLNVPRISGADSVRYTGKGDGYHVALG